MMIDDTPDPEVIRAAGGLVWWRSPTGMKLALVHRPKYDDWSLPKGKLEPGESWEEAALREVREETGLDVKITGFAGTTSYVVKGRPKIVLFWHMERVGDSTFSGSKEVDRLIWLGKRKAEMMLHHPAERALINEQNH